MHNRELPHITRGSGKVGVSKPIQFAVETLEPITTSQKVKIQAQSVVIQNAGDDPVTINHQFTLGVNQSLSFGTGDDYNYYLFQMHFSFAGSGVNPLVEILLVNGSIEGYGTLTSQ